MQVLPEWALVSVRSRPRVIARFYAKLLIVVARVAGWGLQVLLT